MKKKRQEVETEEGEDLMKSVISCNRTSEVADVRPPLGRF